MSVVEKQLVTKNRSGKDLTTALQNAEGDELDRVKKYFKIPSEGRVENDLKEKLVANDETVINTMKEIIESVAAEYPQSPTYAPTVGLQGTYCQGSTLMGIFYDENGRSIRVIDNYSHACTF